MNKQAKNRLINQFNPTPKIEGESDRLRKRKKATAVLIVRGTAGHVEFIKREA